MSILDLVHLFLHPVPKPIPLVMTAPLGYWPFGPQ